MAETRTYKGISFLWQTVPTVANYAGGVWICQSCSAWAADYVAHGDWHAALLTLHL